MNSLVIVHCFIFYQQINLLWYRAVKDPDFKRIFCLVGAEKLPYQVCTEALSAMDEVLKGNTGNRISFNNVKCML